MTKTSDDIEDGGPAFPNEGCGGLLLADQGMSLRDYFAAMAMMGTVNKPEAPPFKTAAVMAYEMADEILKARET